MSMVILSCTTTENGACAGLIVEQWIKLGTWSYGKNQYVKGYSMTPSQSNKLLKNATLVIFLLRKWRMASISVASTTPLCAGRVIFLGVINCSSPQVASNNCYSAQIQINYCLKSWHEQYSHPSSLQSVFAPSWYTYTFTRISNTLSLRSSLLCASLY